MSYPPPPSLFIRPHLGLGDALILNALVRHFAERQPVTFPCKTHNLPSVSFQFRDNPNIEVFPVADDAEADRVCHSQQWSLKLGMFGVGFTFKDWDAVMYKQAGVPFEKRWSGFYYQREFGRELQPP